MEKTELMEKMELMGQMEKMDQELSLQKLSTIYLIQKQKLQEEFGRVLKTNGAKENIFGHVLK